MAYATVDDMTKCYDERLLKDLVSDTGDAQVNLSSDDKMDSALSRAAADINAAVLVGKMYDLDELEELAADINDDNSWVLRELNCELAMLRLIRRRVWEGKYGPLREDLQKGCQAYLDRIRKGERVFNIESNINAGLASVDGLSRYEYDNQRWMRDRYKGFYPARDLPIGRG
jgi:phage gp36-like protein